MVAAFIFTLHSCFIQGSGDVSCLTSRKYQTFSHKVSFLIKQRKPYFSVRFKYIYISALLISGQISLCQIYQVYQELKNWTNLIFRSNLRLCERKSPDLLVEALCLRYLSSWVGQVLRPKEVPLVRCRKEICRWHVLGRIRYM